MLKSNSARSDAAGDPIIGVPNSKVVLSTVIRKLSKMPYNIPLLANARNPSEYIVFTKLKVRPVIGSIFKDGNYSR